MSPIVLVARSEFVRRIRSKWFILTTLLAPVLAVAVGVLPVVAIVMADGDDQPRVIAVVDESGALVEPLRAAAPPLLRVIDAGAALDTLRAQVLAGRLDGLLVLPAGVLDGSARASFSSRGGGGLSQQSELRGLVRETVRAERARAAGASPDVLAALDAPTRLDFVTVSEEGDAAGGAEIGFLVANVLGLLVYVAVLLYGAMVMRGVIEEKANRIVEVIVSSVRPFDLLMGKVLGIGAVGLLQLVAWGGLLLAMSAAIGPLVALVAGPEAVAAASQPNLPGGPAEMPFDPAAFGQVLTPGLVAAFVLFFLGGYLLFASFFAAVGSMVDQESDAQSLQVPILVPIIVPLLFLPYVVDQPESALSVGLSLFPLSSPVLMVVRMTVTAVPLWQVALSLLLLAGAFVGAVWLAARIYRVGILMTGKKATFGDLWRWLRTA